MKLRRKAFCLLIVLLFVSAFVIYVAAEHSEGRSSPARLILRLDSMGLLLELTRNTRYSALFIADFYKSNSKRFPTEAELKERKMGCSYCGWIWENWGRNRFGRENYYYYGYENGNCTFVAEAIIGSTMPSSKNPRVFDSISSTVTHIENEWIIQNETNRTAGDTLPSVLIFGSTAIGSPCLQLIKDIEVSEYKRIRAELLRMKAEANGSDEICVFSEPFKLRIAPSSERKQPWKN